LPFVKAYWRLEKIYLLVIGLVAGIIIQGIPVFLTNPSTFSKEILFNLPFQMALSGTFFTFLIVLWEELWFRNPILNLAENKNQQIMLSVFTGLLFALLHLMNPKINLLHDGLELFLAGVLLTISYYASRSFWLPLGLHFGNNIFSSLIEKTNLDAASTNIGISEELILRWVVLAVAIAVAFLYWPMKKGAGKL
jgi:membrane protease YdiL (CAAX protease family)